MNWLGKMPTAARAVACWSGLAGQAERRERVGRILLLHGTPARAAAQLERQLAWLKRHFQVVSLADMVERLQAGGRRLARTVTLTFDDGLRNNVEVAWPILRRLQIPATFFVCPGLIERREWLWPHENRQRLRHAGPEGAGRLARELGAPAGIEPFMNWMKSLPLAARQAAERAVRAATPHYRPSSAERHDFDVATWDELRTLDPALVTIGSHTLKHPILPSLSEAQADAELGESRSAIEAALQRPAGFFAYPNGDYDAVIYRLVQKHYRAAVDTTEGWASPAADLYRLPRVNVPPGVLRLAAAMHRPRGGVRRTEPPTIPGARPRASQPL